MARARGPFLVMLGLSALAGACGLVIGLEPPHETALPPLPPPPPAPPPTPDPCAHTSAPPKPATDDDPGAELAPFWLAVRRTNLTSDAGGGGLDLDGVCTCDPSPGAKYDGGPSCLPLGEAGVQCDADGGVDNEVARLFGSNPAFSGLSATLEKDIAAGQRTILMYVSKYNGRPNDLDVGVGFALSDGLLTDACDPTLMLEAGDGGPCADGGYCTPAWTGCDQWHAVEGSVALPPSGPIVPIRSGSGYVSNGVLVVGIDTDIPVFLNQSAIRVAAPTLTARLEEVTRRSPMQPRRFRTRDALVTGRLPVDDLARVIFEGNFGGFFLCDNLAFYKSAMAEVCPHVDSNLSPLLDHQPGVRCNALSMAFAIDTEVADIDRDAAAVPPPNTPNQHCAAADASMPPLSETCPP